ncbi:MAG: hypothetical protein DI536_24255 [Archangium gephyra]|uniref:N-formylglutamate amidohydrolase n=1 Tax=Archangium gephyra TaxID=48 RepID=A0A2W5SYS5_9BACT|nr:MAG: hypothetical protein DI536_24255 [Archangium gephyra]
MRFENVEGVIEFEQFLSGTPSQKWLLVDVPHGATRKRDYDAVFAKMKSELPHELEHFFFVNTDIGAPEGAQWLGKTLAPLGINVVFARCLIPRTFIDPNRVVELSDAEGKVKDGLTAAVPAYITHKEDLAWLREQHRRYHQAVAAAYVELCKVKSGLAVQLHSYSPRSVGIEKVDADIVKALHAAYVPEVYATWPERPPVDLISATKDGSFRTAPKLVDSLLLEYARAGIEAKENATYNLAPVATGLLYAVQYPQQVVCVELNRGLVADPFVPFGVSPISEQKVAHMVGPIAHAIVAAFKG